MRRCQVFNISAGVSVPSFAIKPGMSFYAGLRERGEHILEYVFWGVFRSLLWHVPFTINSTLFSYPLRVNGMGGVHPPPMPPGIALKTAVARYAPLRLHLADRAGLDVPVSTCLSDRRPGGQSWMRACVLANFPDAPNPPLSLLSLSCGACLAERKDVTCRGKKKPAGSAGNKHNTTIKKHVPPEGYPG